VIAQRYPCDACHAYLLSQGLASFNVVPVLRLLEAQQHDRVIPRQPLQIPQDLRLTERLKHTVVTDVEDSGSHAITLSALPTRAQVTMPECLVWRPATGYLPQMALARRIVLFLGIAVVALAVALPNTGLAWLRSEIHWLGRSVNWVEAIWPAVDLMHVAIFGLLGVTTRLALPAMPARKLIAALIAFAGISEVMQFWVPGRTPRLSDFGLDLAGVVLSVALATSLRVLVDRSMRRRG